MAMVKKNFTRVVLNNNKSQITNKCNTLGTNRLELAPSLIGMAHQINSMGLIPPEDLNQTKALPVEWLTQRKT